MKTKLKIPGILAAVMIAPLCIVWVLGQDNDDEQRQQ